MVVKFDALGVLSLLKRCANYSRMVFSRGVHVMKKVTLFSLLLSICAFVLYDSSALYPNEATIIPGLLSMIATFPVGFAVWWMPFPQESASAYSFAALIYAKIVIAFVLSLFQWTWLAKIKRAFLKRNFD
jgi:hypothetical protein